MPSLPSNGRSCRWHSAASGTSAHFVWPILTFRSCRRATGRNGHRLSYRDALALHRARHAAAELDPSGYSHVITFLSVGAAYRLGLRDRYALVFGVIAGYVVSGIDGRQ